MGKQDVEVLIKVKAHVDVHFEMNHPICDTLTFNYVHP